MTTRTRVLAVVAVAAALALGCRGQRGMKDAGSGVPAGTIVAYFGLEIPAGWVLCDGRTTSAGKITPDLRDRFVMGLDPANGALGERGGAVTHTHAATVGGPSATKTVDNGDRERVAVPDHTHAVTVESASNLPPYVKLVYIMKE
jgi:hypothetical protein